MSTATRRLIQGGGLTALALLVGALVMPEGALAHGVLLEKRDLPIPEWLFAWAASLVLIVSFAGLSVAWKTTRFEGEHWRPLSPTLSKVLVGPPVQLLAGLFSIALLVLVVYAGIEGTMDPSRNFALTFVFVTFYLGMVGASVLFGDVFRALNPWRAIARTFAAIFKLIAGREARVPLPYPERLGRWPAVVGLIAFSWFELVYSSGINAAGILPSDVADAALIYTGYTLLAMALFGTDTWLDRGETFSVYFGMFASLSAFEVRGGRLGLRRVLSGATRWATHPGSIALVLTTIGVTAFDGSQEGVLADGLTVTFEWFRDRGLDNIAAYRVSSTVWMLAWIGVVSALDWGGVAGMHTVRSGRSTRELGRLFAHTFIPIALAYLIAHYFSLVVYQEQAQFTFLLSDPLGDGSDLFGTADSGIDYGLIGATEVWYVQVAALVVGHVTALILGHDRALAVYDDARRAARSQYWMLALMVGFTSLGLFLLSQANA